MRLNMHTASPSAASRLLPRGWRPTGEPTSTRQSGARTKPWGRHTAAHHNSIGAAPPMTPPMTIAHLRRAEGGFRSEGAPGGAVHGTLLIPPPPGVALRPRPNAHAGGGVRRQQEAGQGREPRAAPQRGSREAAAQPPPPPPHWPASRGGNGPHPPEAGGMVPPPPA